MGRDVSAGSGGAWHAALYGRLRRVAGEATRTGDLPAVLVQLLDVVAAGTRIERLVLADVGEGEPRVVAAHPDPVLSLDAYARLADLGRRALETGETVRDPGDGPAPAGAAGADARRGRVVVPVPHDGGAGALLLGETAADVAPASADVEAVEAMTIVLAPLLASRYRQGTARDLEGLRSDFISRVSHELRTPLTIITGYASTLGAHDDTLSPEQRHLMLDRIVTAAVRLERLLEEVLSLASVEAGLSDPSPRPVPVRDVVDLAVHDRGGSDRVVIEGPERLEAVTDPEIARVVLGALVENALQHGDEVRVTTAGVTDGVRVAVEDDGPGVPPQLASRIFERFVRGDSSEPGLGLGLAIARRLAGVLGARVWSEEVPHGARFVLQLPWTSPVREEP